MRRLGVVGAATAVSGAGLLWAAPSAGASTISYACAVPVEGTKAVSQVITVTVPASVHGGQSLPAGAISISAPQDTPQITVPVNVTEATTPSMVLHLTGGGSVTVTGVKQAAQNVAAGQAPKLDGWTNSSAVTLPSNLPAGSISWTPGTQTLASDVTGIGTETTTCTTSSTVVLATSTSSGPGAASSGGSSSSGGSTSSGSTSSGGGSTSGGTTGGSAGGTLPKTGSDAPLWIGFGSACVLLGALAFVLTARRKSSG